MQGIFPFRLAAHLFPDFFRRHHAYLVHCAFCIVHYALFIALCTFSIVRYSFLMRHSLG